MIKQILANAGIFNLFNRLIGEHRLRLVLVEDYIKPIPGNRILDIACGTGPLLDYLPDVNYTGFDEAPEYIASAKTRHAAHIAGGSACFFEETIENFKSDDPGSFDLVVIIGLLHHLSDISCQHVLETANRALKIGGRLIVLDNIIIPKQNLIAKWIILNDRGKFVRTLENYAKLFESHFADVTFEVRKDLLRIPYTHAVTVATKR